MLNRAPVILIIEDELHMRRLLQVALKHVGYRLLEAANGRDGRDAAQRQKPDVVLLDLGLPDLAGTDVARLIRESSSVPIIVISARESEEQKIAALDAGADDYVTKPFSSAELLARIRAALRRSPHGDPNELVGSFCAGPLHVDFDKRRVSLSGQEVHLTPTEYRLLGEMIRGAGRVVTHRQLLQRVWGPRSLEQTQYLRVFMKQLRHKIEPVPASPQLLLTEPGVGYRLQVPD